MFNESDTVVLGSYSEFHLACLSNLIFLEAIQNTEYAC